MEAHELENARLELAAELCRRHGRKLGVAAWAMEWFGILTFGIEYCNLEDGSDCVGPCMKYVNRGESYARTVIKEGSEVSVSSWGTWYEEAEKEHCSENDVIRCGYCSAFTPLVEGVDWSEIVCDSCGHYVGGGGKPATVVSDSENDE